LGELSFSLWESLEKILRNRRRGSQIYVVPIRETALGWGTPLPPPPSESLDWRGVCKNGLQNIEPLRVRGQNLDFKDLASFFYKRLITAFASIMICFLKFWRKGRCHIGLWISLSLHQIPQWAPCRSHQGKSKSPSCRKHRDKDGAPLLRRA